MLRYSFALLVTFALVFVVFFFFSSGSFPPPFPAESFVVLFVVFFVVFFFVFSFLRPYPPPTTFSRKGNSAVPRSIRGKAGFSFLFLPSFPFFVFRPAYAVGSTRPEGLGGSRDAGPAVAGPRPPYVTEAVRHSG
ncbi:hypothetical protein L249_7092 [Ophiocordyceps polyrhachis-furcata BCC 54312]|uniref:Transmembrane protein n=1 Tax=Ophiocordyceps polyrhachis-furcata BCC 54312 TaxID=1330021 RepID=A0A367LLB1_9HYPO|nr:hypothetical protein L249_7092 [Ophiocordyceps polyrhachis-furcata BCC 54312]